MNTADSDHLKIANILFLPQLPMYFQSKVESSMKFQFFVGLGLWDIWKNNFYYVQKNAKM